MSTDFQNPRASARGAVKDNTQPEGILEKPMTLRNDMTRCTGINLQDDRGLGVAIAGNAAGHVDCIKCQRREPGTNEQQLPQMDPPQFVGGKCQARIAPHRSHPIDAIPL